MAEIETTYQVIKYEVRTRADVGESAMGTMGGWVRAGVDDDDGCMDDDVWMVKTRGGRTRGWRD